MQEFNPMGILVRTTGAIEFLPAEKCHAQSSKVFFSKFGFCPAGILLHRKLGTKGICSNSGRIMSNPLKSLKNLGKKSRQPSNPKEGEVIVWYVPKIRLR